jgi:uncharacterized FAD-dependent dehydrogenase
MILVRNLRLEPGEDFSALLPRAAAKLKVHPGDIKELRPVKRSLDARRKGDIHYVVSAAVKLAGGEARAAARAKSPDVSPYEEYRYDIPAVKTDERPVIAGFGPAGMFAALVLARSGARPIVLERGPDAKTRFEKIEAFRRGGAFDPECNVQFGEGGAGTFSDGKLNTGIHDERLEWMLRQFYEHGAPESVLYDAKPHIGTDVLVDVVRNIRADVIENGGEVRFCHRLTGLATAENRLTGVQVSSPEGEYVLPCGQLILAVGHSARDTFEMLHSMGVPMEPKPFSMGVRIEHRQTDVDLAQYGRARGGLPPADYALNVRLPDGESAYTFCMCPGGEVFAAASETGGVVTNGMSYSARDGENSNSALLVTLKPEDFPDRSVLGGMYWQREIERRAFEYGGGNYFAPAQLCGDFLRRVPSAGQGSVTPSYRPGVRWGELDAVLPEKLTGVLREALPELGKKLRGFDAPDAVLTAPETRSSSPVRILRDGERVSAGLAGLYPCGEGAGYAGGISSAAVDGMRCAEAVLKVLIQRGFSA